MAVKDVPFWLSVQLIKIDLTRSLETLIESHKKAASAYYQDGRCQLCGNIMANRHKFVAHHSSCPISRIAEVISAMQVAILSIIERRPIKNAR